MAAKPPTSSRPDLIAAARAERQRILDSGLPFGAAAEPGGRAEATKERILDTAITLFGERGFEACTTRDLAAEVGIKAPAIYNHYASKEDVLAAAMEHILARFLWTQLAPLDERPVEDWLEAIVKGHVDFQLEHRRLARANAALLEAPSKERLSADVYRRIVGVERGYVELIDVLVRLATPEADHWDGLMAGFAMTAMCDKVVAWHDPNGEMSAAQASERSWRLARQMIGLAE